MAMTFEEISGIFTRAEIKHQFDPDGDIVFSFETQNYTNPKGDKSLFMFASLPKRRHHVHANGPFWVCGEREPSFG